MTPDIRTRYMGLELSSPVVASSSELTNKLDNLKKLEEAGAGAVVLRSLFEEEILAEMERTETAMQRPGPTFPEMAEMDDLIDPESGVADYLELVRGAKKELGIPVIASINGMSAQKWTYFASKLEEQGADALELNIFLQPSDFQAASAAEYEKIYFDIINMVLDQVSIPVSVKVSFYFTLLAQTLQAISKTGIKGLVLFNRFFNPDYNVEDLKIVPTNVLSTPSDLATSLKWVAIMNGRVDCDLAASTGVHDGDGVIKQLLAGANAVQVASTLYRNGLGVVSELNDRLVAWMQEKEYETLDDFRGMLSQQSIGNPAAYDRVQFVKNFRSMK
ncbi:MAG: dihydroorotate dehydrogenase-like protein [Spirochaetes bacterium]|nr:dihydroorotate dehydrogenase-like protein [Spirochaetota bacterium]